MKYLEVDIEIPTKCPNKKSRCLLSKSTIDIPTLFQTLQWIERSFTFPTVKTNLREHLFLPMTAFVVLCDWHLLPEEDVPEKQPARIYQ